MTNTYQNWALLSGSSYALAAWILDRAVSHVTKFSTDGNLQSIIAREATTYVALFNPFLFIYEVSKLTFITHDHSPREYMMHVESKF